ncbi:MAG: N-acetylmuramoyl-L-alanine amidase [Bacillota bacterium]
MRVIRTLSMLVCLIMLLATSVQASQRPVRLVINGQEVVSDVPPIIENGRTLVPVRVISERLEASVEWIESTRTVKIKHEGNEIVLYIDDKTVTVNGKPETLDVPARIVNGRTLVPIRFLANQLNADVGWDESTYTVSISKNSAPLALRQVQWEATGAYTRFTISSSGPARPSVKTLGKSEEYPDRLILDFASTQVAIPGVIVVDLPPVMRIRTATMDNTARVIFDLTEPVRYQVSSEGNRTYVDIYHKVLGYDYDRAKRQVLIRTTGKVDFRQMELPDPIRLVLDLQQTTLSQHITRSQHQFEDPVSGVRIAQFQTDPDVVRAVVDLSRHTGYWLESTDAGILVSFYTRVTAVRATNYGSGVRLTVKATDPVSPKVERLSDPDRLIITVPYAEARVEQRNIEVNSGGVRRIEIKEEARSPQNVVIIVYLAGYSSHTVKPTQDPREFNVEIGSPPLIGKRIVVDPGHGGSDPGAIAPSGVYEKDLVWDIGEQLAKLLKAAGADVYLTREGDQTVGVRDRVRMANSIGADVLISIHMNTFRDKNKLGAEVYHCSLSPVTHRLAEIIQSQLVSLGFADSGVKKAEFYILKETNMPAVLAEIGYLTNPSDERKLLDPAFRTKIADALFKGIVMFFQR